ncbi:MAG: DUF3842 family protein [Oscillospiraceae bacterium]
MKVLIVDGQGGKIGKSIVEQLKEKRCDCTVIAVGTNTAATSAMMKAGADECATGENPVIVAAQRADIIVGAMGIIAANSLLGEITPGMALAISESRAQKVLVPMNRCAIAVAGIGEHSLSEYISMAADMVCELCRK